MDSFFVRSWWVPALRGLAGILFGVLALAWPGMTLVTLILLFAAYALVAGLASVAGAIRHRRTEDEWRIAMLAGVAGERVRHRERGGLAGAVLAHAHARGRAHAERGAQDPHRPAYCARPLTMA
jgi:hypothetical protein